MIIEISHAFPNNLKIPVVSVKINSLRQHRLGTGYVRTISTVFQTSSCHVGIRLKDRTTATFFQFWVNTFPTKFSRMHCTIWRLFESVLEWSLRGNDHWKGMTNRSASLHQKPLPCRDILVPNNWLVQNLEQILYLATTLVDITYQAKFAVEIGSSRDISALAKDHLTTTIVTC